MKIIERLKQFWDYFDRFAEAMDDDPVEDLRNRVARLERRAAQEGAIAEPGETA